MNVLPKAIIFDRDGTLNVSGRNAGGYVLAAEDMQLLPGVAQSLQQLAAMGVRLFVFTQQGCVGKGLLSIEGLAQINAELNRQLAPVKIEKFYYCPHTAEQGCACRKPQPKMLLDCLSDNALKPKEVLVMGDSARDFEAAKAANLAFVHIESDNPKHKVSAEYIQQGGRVYSSVADWLKEAAV